VPTPSDTPAGRPTSNEGSGKVSADWQSGTVIDRRVWPNGRREATAQGTALGPAGEPTTHEDPSIAEPADLALHASLERRRGRGRRLSDFTRRAEEGEMTKEQFMFLMAIDEFKKANEKTFPTWTDVLEIVRLLGYRKTMPSELNLRRAEDWREQATAPANVRPKGWEGRRAA
jgi:hypothetical protein